MMNLALHNTGLGLRAFHQIGQYQPKSVTHLPAIGIWKQEQDAYNCWNKIARLHEQIQAKVVDPADHWNLARRLKDDRRVFFGYVLEKITKPFVCKGSYARKDEFSFRDLSRLARAKEAATLMGTKKAAALYFNCEFRIVDIPRVQGAALIQGLLQTTARRYPKVQQACEAAYRNVGSVTSAQELATRLNVDLQQTQPVIDMLAMLEMVQELGFTSRRTLHLTTAFPRTAHEAHWLGEVLWNQLPHGAFAVAYDAGRLSLALRTLADRARSRGVLRLSPLPLYAPTF